MIPRRTPPSRACHAAIECSEHECNAPPLKAKLQSLATDRTRRLQAGPEETPDPYLPKANSQQPCLSAKGPFHTAFYLKCPFEL